MFSFTSLPRLPFANLPANHKQQNRPQGRFRYSLSTTPATNPGLRFSAPFPANYGLVSDFCPVTIVPAPIFLSIVLSSLYFTLPPKMYDAGTIFPSTLGEGKPFCAITVIAIIPHPLATSEAIP